MLTVKDREVKQEPEDADEEHMGPQQSCQGELEDDLLNTSTDSTDKQGSPLSQPAPQPPPSVEDVMRKWNMFQFGEVIVPNHPTIPVVPMAPADGVPGTCWPGRGATSSTRCSSP